MPEDGVYALYLTSRADSRLLVDGGQVVRGSGLLQRPHLHPAPRTAAAWTHCCCASSRGAGSSSCPPPLWQVGPGDCEDGWLEGCLGKERSIEYWLSGGAWHPIRWGGAAAGCGRWQACDGKRSARRVSPAAV